MDQRKRPAKREPSPLARKLRQEFVDGATMLNVADVAHAIDRDESTVLRLIRSGELPAVKRGREYEITEEDLRAYVDVSRQEQREKTRIKRLERQEKEEYQRLRGTPAAGNRAYLPCDNCGRKVLLAAGLGGEAGEKVAWTGTCPYCESYVTYDWAREENRSIADEDVDAAFDEQSEEDSEIPF